MGDTNKQDDHDARARRLLEGIEVEGFIGAQIPEQTTVVREVTYLNILDVLEFLLGERDFDENIFEYSQPERQNAKGLILRTRGAQDQHLFVWEGDNRSDFVKVQLRKVEDFEEGEKNQVVTLGTCMYQVVLSRRKILTVRFEITKVKVPAGERIIRSVRIENKGGWFVYVSDDGMMQCCPGGFSGDTDTESDEIV